MARRRFRKGETFTSGQAVEVRNGSQWHPATVTGPLSYDGLGSPYYPTQTTVSRGVIRAGARFNGYPTMIRPGTVGEVTA